jgi:WD40 repeat protein
MGVTDDLDHTQPHLPIESTPTVGHGPGTSGGAVVAPPGYEVERELGRGGMGVVYLARQVGLDRSCALKVIRSADHASEIERQRFQTEARAIARLAHPNIVQVYEIGEHQGLPFMALEFCAGGSLTEQLAREPLAPRVAATLVRTLAGAVEVAHQAKIVHRDIKPANILLTATGEPKLTDFGLARLLEATPADLAGPTASGAVLGTPSYMPPEQARGDKDLGPAVDVYALGAVLYACLTGRPPFLAATTMDTLFQVIQNEPVPIRQLNPTVPTDLETIVHKCLAKEPGRRYGSAQALADDLGNFLDGRPIAARPVGVLERGYRWVQRNPVVASLTLAVVLVLLAGVAVSSSLAVIAWRAADSALDLARREAAAKGIALFEKNRAEEAEREVRTQLDRVRRSRVNAALVRATQFLTSDLGAAKAVLLDGDECPWDLRDPAWHWLYFQAARPGVPLVNSPSPFPFVVLRPGSPLLAASSLIGDAPIVVVDTASGKVLWTNPAEQQHRLRNLQFVNEGLVGCFEPMPQAGPVRIVRWEATTGNVLATREVQADLSRAQGRGGQPTVSPDGKLLAFWYPSQVVPSPSLNGSVKVVEIATGKEVAHLDLKMPPGLFCFSPDSASLVLGGPAVERTPGKCTFWVWELETGKERALLKDAGTVAQQMAFDPDGQWLAGTDSTGQVRIWNWRTGMEVKTVPAATNAIVTGLHWPSRDSLAILRADGSVTVARPPGNNAAELEVKPGSGPYLAVLPDRRLLSLSPERHALLVHPLSGSPVRAVLPGPSRPTALAVSPIGRRVALADESPAVRVVDLDGGLRWSLAGAKQGRPASALAFSPDGRTLAIGTEVGKVRLFDADTGQERVAGVPDFPGLRCLEYVGEKRMLLGLVPKERQPGTIVLWDLAANREERRWEKSSGFFVVAADRSTVAVVGLRADGVYGELHVWSVADWSELGVIPGTIPASATNPVLRNKHCPVLPDLSADGKIVAWIDLEGKVRLWDVGERRGRPGIRWPDDGVRRLAGFTLSGDGRTAVATTDAGGLVLWDTTTSAARVFERTALWEGLLSHFVRFTPDGSALVFGQEAGGLGVADLRGGPRTVTVDPGQRGMGPVAFSPDGRLLASVSGQASRSVILWDLKTGQQVRDFEVESGVIHCLAFSPDSKMVAAGCASEVVLWQLVGEEAPRRAACEKPVAELRFHPSGKQLAVVLREVLPNLLRPGEVWVRETADLTVAPAWARPRPGYTVAYTPDGRTLLVGLRDVAAGGRTTAEVVEYDAGTGEAGAKIPIFAPQLALSPSGRYLALGGGGLKLWDRQEGKQVPVGQDGAMGWPEFVDEGTLLVTGMRKILQLAVPEGKVLREVPNAYTVVGVQRGGRQVAVLGQPAGLQGRIQILDLSQP